MAWRSALDRALADRIREELTTHPRPPASRDELAQWVWPGIIWDQTTRIEQAIRMTQDYAEELEGCVSYSPRHGGHIWMDREKFPDQLANIAQSNVIKGVSRVALGVGTVLKSSAFILRMLADKSGLPPRLRREIHDLADLFDYAGKTIKSRVENLRDIA